jgi:hypothetical protein
MEAIFWSNQDSTLPTAKFHVYLHDTEYARLDIFMEFEENGIKQQTHKVILSTPNHGYMFQRSLPDGNFALISKHGAGELLFTIYETAPFVTIPIEKNGVSYDSIIYNFEEKKLYSFLPAGKPNFLVTSVTIENDDEDSKDSLVNVSIGRTGMVSHFKEFCFLRDRMWALVKSSDPYWVSSTQPGIITFGGMNNIKVEYGDNSKNGIPLIKSVTFSKIDPQGKIVSESRYEITKIVPGKPDLKIFDPKQFLPPGTEVGNDVQPAHFSLGRLLLIGSGVFLVALGIWMKMKKQNN